MRQQNRRGQLGELPADRYRTGQTFDPGSGVKFKWINKYVAAPYPFVLAPNVPLQILPANPLRAYLIVQNKDAAADLLINFGSEAGLFNGIIIIPRGNYEFIGGENGGSFVPSNSISLFSTAAITGIVIEGVLPAIDPNL